jgi:hypothetical protein
LNGDPCGSGTLVLRVPQLHKDNKDSGDNERKFHQKRAISGKNISRRGYTMNPWENAKKSMEGILMHRSRLG